jgi:YkoY family integral membrane protein
VAFDFGTLGQDLGQNLFTVLLLVLLEGLLSADNALVLAVIVMPLPPDEQRKALRYGLIGAFVLRIIATIFAAYLAKFVWVWLIGGAYLLYLPIKHFTHKEAHHDAHGDTVAVTKTFLGLSLFWTIVVRADLIDLVFAVDSILAAVGLTKVLWVIITGGLLGIVMMRVLTMQVVALVERWPKLIDGAYIIIAWVGIKLIWEWGHHQHYVPEMPQWLGIGMVVVLFIAAVFYAKAYEQKQAVKAAEEEPERVEL